MARTFDTLALRRPFVPSEVRRYRRQVVDAEGPSRSRRVPAGRVIAWVMALVWVPYLAGQVAASGFGASFEGAVAIGVLLFVAGLAAGFVVLRAPGPEAMGPWLEQLRCLRFAAANQLEYARRTDPANYPGIIFQIGFNQQIEQRVWSASGSFFDCGIQQVLAGPDHRERLHAWRYVAFQLPGVLPGLLLNARVDEKYDGDLGEFCAADRARSLDGVLDEHFRLYCRPEDWSAAFYVFTPDVMALLIDLARDLDVEIAEDWLFFYSRWHLLPSDPRTWHRIAVLQEEIVPLISRKARGYGDRDFR